jgi:Ran GTPase-activating protein (RanGAP) involved in mRNA processing and transport
MNARKIRKKKREEFEIQRNELLQLNYPPHYDKSYQNHLETDDNERIVLKMCYGVNAHMNDLHKLDLKRQEKCRPIVEGMLTAVLDWQHVLEEREVEEERVASETPRTVEKRMKEQKKADKLRLKAIKKEHKGISMEDAEDLLYQEQNPPQKTEQVEVKERYEANCKLTFSSAMLSSDEIEAKRLAAEAALEIPTVRLRIECAKALKNADFIGLSDPFVVVYDSIKLNPNDEALEDVVPKDEAIKGSKPKDNTPNAPNVPIGTTQVVDDSLEPVWDEGFDVHIGNIDDFMLRKFRFEVYDYDIIGDNEFLGACQLTGEEVLERCGKPNKYWNLSGMKGKSMTYVGGRIKLGFDLLGDGGFSSGNDVYSETLDIPALGDTPLDFLAYGLYRSGLEMIKLETEHWIPVRHILGKLPNTTNAESTREDKDNIRDALKTCTLKGLGMSPIEQSLVVKCLAFNTLVEHLDWGSNKIEPTVLMSLCWLFQESNSLEHINLYPCSLDINSQMCRLACAEITKGLVSSLRPQTIRLSPNGGYLRVQHLIGRYLSIDESAATEEHALVTEEPSCLNLRSRILEMNEPIHLLDDILVANLIWLSTAQINAKEEERLMLAAQKEVDESDKEEKEKGKKKQEALEEELNFFDTHDAQENNDEENENGPHKLTYSSVESANGIYIRPGQQLLDYAKRLLHQCEVAYICTQLRPMDTCRIIYLSFEACGLDSNSKYPISSSSLLMSALTSNRSVTDLNLSDNQIGAHHDCGESLKTLLSSNNRLLNVNMSRNPLGYISKPYPSSTSGAICAMAEGLSMNTNLRALALSDCGVQVKGAEALGISLTKNTSLLSLDLSRNHGVTRYGAVCLANGLERNSGLETLNCAGCSMGMAGATAVAKMLQTNTTLIHLNMSGNPTDKRGSAIQCFGALAIALALRENCTLQSLSLAASGIESAGATYIAHALVVNTTLLTLDLEGVRPHEIRARQPMKPPIRKDDQNVDPLYFEELDLNAIVSKKEEVALRLAMARQIKLKEELQHIAGAPGFDGRIHREGALAIAQALKKNKTLTELSVAQNYIMNEGTEALLGAVLEHPKMMALDLSGSNMNEQIVDKLIQKLHRRSRQENPEASTSAMSAPSASSASTTKTTTTTSNETSNFRYLLLTGAELGREAVAKLQDACETQKITLHCFEDSPLLELEELDADDDPMKEIREVQRKVQEKTAQEAIRSRFVVYSEDFPYESKGIAMKDNFNRCPETWQAKLRAAAELDNPAPLQKLIDELEDLTPEPEATAAAKGPDKKYKRGRHQ